MIRDLSEAARGFRWVADELDLVINLGNWKTDVVVLLVGGLAPSLVLLLIVLAYRSREEREKILEELWNIPLFHQPFWILYQCVRALRKGVWPRVVSAMRQRSMLGRPDGPQERASGLADESQSELQRLSDEIAADVAASVALFEQVPSRIPPPDYADVLWRVGIRIDDTSTALLSKVVTGFESTPHDTLRRQSIAYAQTIDRIADEGRRLPCPEFAPHALGAIDCQARAASRRGTDRGFLTAQVLHQEARWKRGVWEESVSGNSPKCAIALDEMRLKLDCGEAETACVTTETVVECWRQGLHEGRWADDERAWLERFDDLLTGGRSMGDLGLETLGKIERSASLVYTQTEERRLLSAARAQVLRLLLNTARAHVLHLPFCSERDVMDVRLGFEHAYTASEEMIHDEHGGPVAVSHEHRLAVVQLRLNYALLTPGAWLPSCLKFARCLRHDYLDDDAVRALSSWLAGSPDRGRRGHAGPAGSATWPTYFRRAEARRRGVDPSDDLGYTRWRREWPQLDRYFGEPGRLAYVQEALAAASS